MAQIISIYEGNRYKDTHQEVTTWQRLYTSMNKIKDKRNKVKAKTTKKNYSEMKRS